MPPVRDARQDTTTSYFTPLVAARMESGSATSPNATVASGKRPFASSALVLPPMPDFSRTSAVTS